jgi:hypothetical protein
MDVNLIIGSKDNIPQLANNLSKQDIAFLISQLNEKNDEIRYPSFLILQQRSRLFADVYPYWDTLAEKLENENSYQRSIGIMLLAENIRWDSEKRFAKIFESFMSHCSDEKFITSRQTIQSITQWAEFVPELLPRVVEILTGINVASLKDTQRKLILLDIINALIEVRKVRQFDEIDAFISSALTGGILDKKSIKQIEGLIK